MDVRQTSQAPILHGLLLPTSQSTSSINAARFPKVIAAVAVGMALAGAGLPARAQTTVWIGNNSTNWFFAGNWTNGVPVNGVNTNIDTIATNPTVLDGGAAGGPAGTTRTLVVGDSGMGMLTIQNGGTLSSTGGARIGANTGSEGTVTVTGPGSAWNTGGPLDVGGSGQGTLIIQNGGIVSSNISRIGASSTSQGAVMVTGPGSAWNDSGRIDVGGGGSGMLTIADGGTVTSGDGQIGAGPVGSIPGTVMVTGPGSSWTTTDGILVGAGTLTIENGGVVSGAIGAIGNAGPATVLVTGAGSAWNMAGDLFVGILGLGTLTIADGGIVSAGSAIMGQVASADGIINIGAAPGDQPTNPGMLNSPTISSGPGSGTLNFNHTATDYVFAPAVSGAIDVNALAGTTIFTAANTYGGMTLIDGGTLKAGAAGTFSPNSPHTVTGAGVLDLAGFSQTVLGLTNAGLVNFGTGTAPGTTLTTTNYVGQGGTLAMNTFLGADSSPTDRLVINGGTANGTSNVTITNAGGPGAQTTGAGIPVVVTANGGITAAGAFSLGGRVAAGPFEYLLFRGDQNGVGEDWFLRSHLVDPVDPDPIFRPEVPVYAAAQQMARQAALVTLGTFHERQGDQALLRGAGYLPASWGRGFGQHTEQSWSGTVSPEFDGTVGGFQAGQDVFAMQDPSGERDRFGFFVGYANARGDVKGFALGQLGFAAGRVDIDATSFGGYWTHIGPSGWYVDAVAMGTWFETDARSHLGIGIEPDGSAFTGSLEGGYPVRLGWGLTLEPQAQIVYQSLSLDRTRDRFSTVAFSDEDAWTGRLGARLQGLYPWGAASWSPYLKANLWHHFSGNDTVLFSDTHPIVNAFDSTALELGGGIVGKLTGALDLYTGASYTTDLDGRDVQTFAGNIGLRYTW